DHGARNGAGLPVDGYLDGHDPGADLPRLAAMVPRIPALDAPRTMASPSRPVPRIAPVRRAWPLRPPDSFFLHVQTRSITQQVGAVITVEPEAGAAPLTGAVLRQRLVERLPVMVTLRRRLVPRGDWRRPGWVAETTVDVDEHLSDVTVRDEDGVRAAVDWFWSRPLSLRRPPWELMLVRQEGSDIATLCFKMHHAIGDGLSMVGTLDRLMDLPDEPPGAPDRETSRRGSSLRRVASLTGKVARGMWELGWHAAAPTNPLNRELTPNQRGVLTVPLPTGPVREAAHAHQVRTSELMLGVVADALRRAGVVGGPGEPTFLRTMLPVAMPGRTGGRIAGNLTGAVSINLPVGPMSVLERVHAIRRDLHRRIELGEPHAAAFVMRALGMFPAPVHGWMAARVYNSQFFNMIASYVPGPRTVRRIAGNRFRAVYPVGALAEGVPLGVGIMRNADVTGVCVLFDESLRSAVQPLPEAIRASFAELLPDAEMVPDDAARST
ncbi:MAG: wax ester/triacylglycerol synthase domain-containing protein, partial [Actinocatenispora sp.]